MIRVYTQQDQGQGWLRRYWGHRPRLACILGFTETGLIPGISAAGITSSDRQTTAIADVEFLHHGVSTSPKYPLPVLTAGVSPAIIARAIIAAQRIPLTIFNAGLPIPPTVPHIDLQGVPAACLTSGQALPRATVESLFRQGLGWGHRLGNEADAGYLVLGECVVGGTTTALALLLGLGVPALGKVGSSHLACNHNQKQTVVTQGLKQWQQHLRENDPFDPLDLVAAVGDPMQVVVAAMALTASCHSGVLLAGGTQMLAVYALARALAAHHHIPWQPERITVGTTRWVAEDPTCDTVGLTRLIGDVPLLATQLSFANSRHEPLQHYEAGYVKEGVAAGGCAIAAHLYQNWQQPQLLSAIETLFEAWATQQPLAPTTKSPQIASTSE
ncbi:MAG: TIGR00303 family protein [Leptolyngbya sp. SIO1E4]|nr:TIGR00303 family protein [Leptolyngbya sp. SIO1E4]